MPARLRSLLSLALLSCLALPPSLARAAEPDTAQSLPHITVTGRAHIDVVPDIATLSVAVATERPKASDAVADNSQATHTLISQLKSEGFTAQDIKTVSITLVPVYDTQRDPVTHVSKRILRGYRARNSLTITVHDISKAGLLAREVIDKGVNEFYGISFDYSKKTEAYDKLRGEAVADALRKAKAYMPPLGLKLGRVLEISPAASVGQPRGAIFAASVDGSGPTSIPIEPGTQTLEIEVKITFEVTPEQ
jgi:uncharacterized protein YggE